MDSCSWRAAQHLVADAADQLVEIVERLRVGAVERRHLGDGADQPVGREQGIKVLAVDADADFVICSGHLR